MIFLIYHLIILYYWIFVWNFVIISTLILQLWPKMCSVTLTFDNQKRKKSLHLWVQVVICAEFEEICTHKNVMTWKHKVFQEFWIIEVLQHTVIDVHKKIRLINRALFEISYRQAAGPLICMHTCKRSYDPNKKEM